MHVLYLSLAGESDPTRASIALHIAVNGSLATGQQATVVLGGDASGLIREGMTDTIEGVGVPPLRELLAAARERDLAVYV